MTRIRIALLAVSLGLMIPVGLLVVRALDGVALERSVRHEAVAERAFEEMERALTTLLQAEEERPFAQYRFYLPADARDAGGVAPPRSPLATLPAESFVVGYFQIDPDGTLHTPMRPRNLSAARRAGDWPPADEIQGAIATLERVVGGYWRDAAKRPARAAPAGAAVQPPGTTWRAAGPALGESQPSLQQEADELESAATTAFEVLRSFNRAAEERAERKQKVTEQAYSKLYGGEFGQREPAAPPAPAEAPRVASVEGRADTGRVEAAAVHGALRKDEGLLDVVSVERDRSEDAPTKESTVRIALDPMVGDEADAEHLLLSRTVLVGEQGYRQGLLVRRRALADWLSDAVIDRSALAALADASLAGLGPDTPLEDSGFVFQHRFAEPFDALAMRLHVKPLPGVASPSTIYALAALVLGVGLVGILAVYRMVSVVVHFAERRNNFVAAVSHELKTPLTAIRMYGEMLRDGLVDSDAKRSEYHHTITDESERLTRLINNVLEFSRLEREQREMNLAAGPIGPVLAEVVEKLRPHAKRQGFTLRAEIDPDLPILRFDRDAMLQVLFNLVDNAMKYARNAPRKEILLGASREGERVIVAVRDFGPGVPRRQLRRVFEPFYRGGEELTRATKGTGIGLALVKDLAERMGAAVSGHNPQDGGFCIRLAFRPAKG
jgi:signal transduction histidine kinase